MLTMKWFGGFVSKSITQNTILAFQMRLFDKTTALLYVIALWDVQKKKKSWKVTSHNNQNLLFLTHMGIKITGTVIFNCTCTIVIILPLNLAHLSYLMQEIFQSSDTVCLSEKVFPLTSLLYALKNEN